MSICKLWISLFIIDLYYIICVCGQSQDLEFRRAALFLAVCNGTNLWLNCLGFCFLLCLWCTCLLLGNNKIILLKIFLRGWLFVLGKISWLGLIFLNFTIGNFVIGLIFFGLVYFILEFRSINFFYDLWNDENASVTNYFTNCWYGKWLILVSKKVM